MGVLTRANWGSYALGFTDGLNIDLKFQAVPAGRNIKESSKVSVKFFETFSDLLRKMKCKAGAGEGKRRKVRRIHFVDTTARKSAGLTMKMPW